MKYQKKTNLEGLSKEKCKCQITGDPLYLDDEECYCGILIQHYHCSSCGGLLQVDEPQD